MAKFPTGADAILASAEAAKGGGRRSFSRELFWRDNDKKYLQFITPLKDIPTVPLYKVKVGVSSNGKPIMRPFIDPRPFEGKDAYNPLASRWGLEPSTKQIAVVVELEPVYEKVEGRKMRTGFQVSERQFTYKKGDRAGEEGTAANVGLVINSHLFFKYLTTWQEDKGPITNTPFQVVRVGADKNTTYNFIPYEGEKVELSPEIVAEIDLQAYCDKIMSEAYYRELLDHLPDEWVPDRYAAQRQAAAAKSAKTAVADNPTSEEDVEEVEAEAEAVSEDDAAQKKFDDLRARYG